MSNNPVILSGMQPSSNSLHLGNYIGALGNWVTMQDEFTPEGFMVSYFFEDPTVTVRVRDSYFIFNGDYKPYSMRQFVKSEGRWVEDSSRPVGKDVFQVGPLKGEAQMLKGKILKEIKSGVYVLDVQKGGRQASFAFRIP